MFLGWYYSPPSAGFIPGLRGGIQAPASEHSTGRRFTLRNTASSRPFGHKTERRSNAVLLPISDLSGNNNANTGGLAADCRVFLPVPVALSAHACGQKEEFDSHPSHHSAIALAPEPPVFPSSSAESTTSTSLPLVISAAPQPPQTVWASTGCNSTTPTLCDRSPG